MSEEVRDAGGAAAWLAAEPRKTGLFSDFDGTISPIVARPRSARPLPGATDALKFLASRLAVVGVVSGRPIAFLTERLELPDHSIEGASMQDRTGPVLHAYGLHGIEHWDGAAVEIEPAVLEWTGAVQAARDGALEAAIPGVAVEDKVYGVTLHWRNAPDPSAVEPRAVALAARLATANGLRARPGKASVELVPPVGVDKGTVVRRWGEDARVERVGFLGDDVSDVLAFEALDSLAAEKSLGVLKVAVTGPDAPSALLDGADVVLESPSEAVALLCLLADSLRASGP